VRRQSGAATALWVLTDGTLSVVKINLIRLGGLAAVLAGILRLLSSVLPTTSPRIMALYLVIDILLLISSIGLFEFQRLEAGIPEKLALETKTLPHWVLFLLILSTVIGPIGFFSPRLSILFPASGIVFGIGFATAGTAICLPRRHR
jgi:hypothetical protein